MTEVPGWSFAVTEESAGHYCARGYGPRGMTVERHSVDPDEALAEAANNAPELNSRARLE